MTAAEARHTGRATGLRLWWRSARAVWWRGNLRTARFPGLVVTVAFFPLFFLLAYSGLFPALTDLPEFPTDSFVSWLVPFTLLQAAAFSGLGAGFSTGNDIDTGFQDRLLMMPAHRSAILVGTILMSLTRAIGVGVPVFLVGLLVGVEVHGGVLGLLCLLLATMGLSVASSCFSLGVMYRAQDQRVAPLFQVVIFMTLFTSTAQVPLSVATGWLHTAARLNPVTNILELARQATLPAGWSWGTTWPGLVALTGLVLVLGAYAVTGLRRLTP
ncbi:MAG: ABC transporter permease [Actinomycetota bacterium]